MPDFVTRMNQTPTLYMSGMWFSMASRTEFKCLKRRVFRSDWNACQNLLMIRSSVVNIIGRTYIQPYENEHENLLFGVVAVGIQQQLHYIFHERAAGKLAIAKFLLKGVWQAHTPVFLVVSSGQPGPY